MLRALAAVLAALLCAACGSLRTDADATLHQRLAFDDALRTVAVRATFAAGAPRRIRLRRPDAVATARAEPSGATLRFDGDGVAELPAGTAAVEYVVDLARLPWEDAQRDEHGVLLDPSSLLCRAADGPPRRIVAEVRAPPGMRACVPWPTSADRGDVPPSVFRNLGRMAVGDFEPVLCRSGATQMECVALAPLRASADDIARCVTAAADAALPLAGDGRPRRILVLLRPSATSAEPVLFGETLYGGGTTLQLLVGARADGADLLGEWVVVHEMVHLALPRVRREDAWLSEGLATYYQNVLRARAGMLDEQDAWDAFAAGVARGRPGAGGHSLDSDSRWMGARHGYLRVYWSGAAIALLWDVALRRERGNTLDDALREAARAFPPGADPVPAADVLAHLDAWLGGEPLFGPIARRWLAAREFPDVDATLRALGADGPFLDDGAPAAALRRAITTR